MRLPFVLLLLICPNAILLAQINNRFRIISQGKTGYVDSIGTIVIPVRYFNGAPFSEGLAAVRENGLYGYIDTAGRYVLPPAYDIAQDFRNGIARVFIDGKPVFIDRQGKKVISGEIIQAEFYNDKQAIIKTRSGRMGLMDMQHYSLITDTIYEDFDDFSGGLSVVTEYRTKNRKKREKKAVIDTAGQIIVPFGIYDHISTFCEGYARVGKSKKKDEEWFGVIDTKGKALFLKKLPRDSWIYGSFYSGLAKLNLSSYWKPEEGSESFETETETGYNAYVDIHGNLKLNDTTVKNAMHFSCGRTFIEKEKDHYYLYDTNFNEIGSTRFSEIKSNGFENGIAIVRTYDQWGIIDTSGNFLVPARYNNIIRVMGNFFVHSLHTDEDETLYGLTTLSNEPVVPMIMSDYDPKGFTDGLLLAVINGRTVYINQKGIVIWKDDTTLNRSVGRLNIDYMNRGYFYAYSSPKGPGTGHYSGGWGVSKNIPKPVNTSIPVVPDSLQLYIDTLQADTFAHRYKGFRLFLVNATKDTITLDAQDSRLYINLQAKDKNNIWQDVEYLPNSWCGNSYHSVTLPQSFYWSFIIPDYDGEFPTEIRAKLSIFEKRKHKKKKTRYIYSNAIEGKINPGQFWMKQRYNPAGLMDPYFE